MTFEISERDQLILDWQASKKELETAQANELELRNKIVDLLFRDAPVGTNNLELGKGYTLKVVKKLNHSLANGDHETDNALDAIEKLGNRGAYIAEDLVSWKPSISLTTLKKLDLTDPTDKKIHDLISGVMTTKPATPTVELVLPKGS